MKRKALLVVASFIVAGFTGTAMADDLVPGATPWNNSQVMGVGKTMMEMGAADRAHSANVVRRSGAASANQGGVSGMNTYFQFGSSQSDQSWKTWRTLEDVGVVVGLVPGDCRGDNSDGKYRAQMNQSREGFMKEILVPNSQCAENHPTLK